MSTGGMEVRDSTGTTGEVDVIVVGSGASATSAACPLVGAGLKVLMLDVGNVDTHYAPLIPDLPFTAIRRLDRLQHRYFLGDSFEGIPFGDVRVGAQLTPPRAFIRRGTEELTPILSDTFGKFESLALGGLAAGWGAVAVEYDDDDLADFPVRRRDLAPHYETVAARVGIAGARDDLLPFYGDCRTLLPPLLQDSNGRLILETYARKRERLNRRGVYLGHPRLAVLSADHGTRKAQSYHDMDFYADKERSVFRPSFAVEEMRAFPNFRYVGRRLVERFRELPRAEGVEVEALDVDRGATQRFSARRLVLAAGALGTARIVLRSLGKHDVPVPLVSNPYTYVPCIHLRTLGRAVDDARHSLTQVGIVLSSKDSGRRLVHAQIYSYRSLLLFKLAKEAFLPVRESIRVMRDLASSFVIVGIHHEDRPTSEKYCILRKAGPGKREPLEVSYGTDPRTGRERSRSERIILGALRSLGCWPLRRIDPGSGASIHYGGTIPMSSEERELTVTPRCLLRGTRSVYLADGSVFPYLPAKALTLSLMANADRVGHAVLEEVLRG